jgi:SAM-dependent methyltransferase
VSLVGRLHGGLVFPRRVRVLAERIAPHLPSTGRALDLGCGDGQIAAGVLAIRPGLSINGADVLARPKAHIPVDLYDGTTLPYADRSFDAVMIVDVLHHTDDPVQILREARRICRGVIVLKDHLCDPWLGRARLALMDFVGNARHGVAMTHKYWERARWHSAFRELGLEEEFWDERLGLYPRIAAWLFEDSLHFLARLRAMR